MEENLNLRKMLTLKEVSEYFGVAEKSVPKMLKYNKIPIHRIGHRTVRVNRDDIENFLKTKQSIQS